MIKLLLKLFPLFVVRNESVVGAYPVRVVNITIDDFGQFCKTELGGKVSLLKSESLYFTRFLTNRKIKQLDTAEAYRRKKEMERLYPNTLANG